jgi:hypothetical protein
VAVWRVQAVVEVCTAMDYPAWRKARERAWKRDGNRYSVHTWPDRITEGESAAVLLMQSHGGKSRGHPAEIAVPTFAHGVPARGHDIERPYEPLALSLLVGWIKLALADERHAARWRRRSSTWSAGCPGLASRATSASTGRSSQASRPSVLGVADGSGSYRAQRDRHPARSDCARFHRLSRTMVDGWVRCATGRTAGRASVDTRARDLGRPSAPSSAFTDRVPQLTRRVPGRRTG